MTRVTAPLPRRLGTFLLSLFWAVLGLSQDASPQLLAQMDSLVLAAPRTYAEIDLVLRPIRKDTALLNTFISKAKASGYLDGLAYALNQKGRVYRGVSEYTEALSLFQEAHRTAIQAKNVEFEIYGLNMMSVVFRRTEAIKSALDYSQEALELAEAIPEPSTGIKRSMNVSLNSIANIYKLLEQYDLAIEKYRESIALDQELNNKLGLAINHQNLGECYEAQGLLDEALENYDQSLAFNEQIDSEKGRVICYYSIAHVYVHQGRTQEALSLLRTSLEKAKTLGDQKIMATVLTNLGWTYLNIGEYAQAEAELTKALELSKTYHFPSEMAEANKFLSELWIKQDNYQKGMAFYKEYKNFEEETNNNLNLRYVNDMIQRYESEKRASQIERLAQENESVRQRLRKNQTMLLVSGIGILLIAGILYILYRQYQLNSEKKLLTLEQTMLRSQMNPHFLFNSLNSIKLYIINNEQKNAVHYLNKFSKLVRKILEASSQREISLAEELETIALYMNIENIRFNDEINFTITVDDAIDVHQIKIPSLILQPFLENALWHGLSSKEGEKRIALVVEPGEKGFINIGITDNGVGRDQAERIKQNKVLKRKSVGIDITKERLANFSKDFLNSFAVEIIDLYDGNNAPEGTRIVLHIPIE
ncbi:tetratricopeptide repeat protein [Maribacter sp. 2307ULW6-5]|uniref:tetratricopeptide repeat protein n=1 Tax=Maribacter sp. 2307ULW6-5 TaxID=3386275 RepID=UPI0039BC8E73